VVDVAGLAGVRAEGERVEAARLAQLVERVQVGVDVVLKKGVVVFLRVRFDGRGGWLRGSE
jgi:hypothetical protein